MNAREELGTVIMEQANANGLYIGVLTTDSMAAAILDAGYRKPRTITTREELQALIEGAVIIDSAGDVAELRGGYWCGYETAAMSVHRQGKYLPATVIHEATK